MENLDLDSLFLILNELSYKDLYNFPKLNKFYKTLEQNPYYLQLLSKKKNELYDRAYVMLINYLIEVIDKTVGFISFDETYDLMVSSTGYELLKGNTSIDVDLKQARSFIYIKLRENSVITISISKDPENTEFENEILDYWKLYDPDSIMFIDNSSNNDHDEFEIRITPSIYIERLIHVI